MNAPGVVHELPPVGGTCTRCCLALPAELPAADLYSRDPDQITCTVRAAAELPADQDDGESPFGWRG
ncbi:hypothetical protein [Streptomyces parvulus]|uniref:hypothetical protein n=1 Tax=Streptomyces parvulus TaxID=146923 RepID=UPI0037F7E4D3